MLRMKFALTIMFLVNWPFSAYLLIHKKVENVLHRRCSVKAKMASICGVRSAHSALLSHGKLMAKQTKTAEVQHQQLKKFKREKKSQCFRNRNFTRDASVECRKRKRESKFSWCVLRRCSQTWELESCTKNAICHGHHTSFCFGTLH